MDYIPLRNAMTLFVTVLTVYVTIATFIEILEFVDYAVQLNAAWSTENPFE